MATHCRLRCTAVRNLHEPIFVLVGDSQVRVYAKALANFDITVNAVIPVRVF